MSIDAITWALTQPIKHSTAKFVLVALANCADGQDLTAWPSTAYLAEATGQDRKTVQANMNRLRELGYIEDTGDRKGFTKQVIVYRLKEPENGQVKQSQKRNSSENGTHPKKDIKRPVFPHKEAQISPETGPKTVHGTVNEPSMNRQGTVNKEPEKKSRIIPADFGISDRVEKWAAEKGHSNLQAHLEYFIGYARANGKKYIDWDEAFMNAIRSNWAKISGQVLAFGGMRQLNRQEALEASNQAIAERALRNSP
jgi:DNA-binding transcriptional MocR family regulator